MKIFNQQLIEEFLAMANDAPRKRVNLDLRNTSSDTSQRMLNALMPDTVVPIHKHDDTSETVICLRGSLEEVFFESINDENTEFKEVKRFLLCPAKGIYGMQIPKGIWHTVNVIEPSVIFESKDGAYKK